MLLYLLVFFAKMVEVTLATVRNVLINRGAKLQGALIGFVEVIIWVILVSTVLASIAEDPLKILFYALGFSMGNYVGVIIQNKLAIGTSCIQAVVSYDKKEEISESLRAKGFGVTNIYGEGKDGPVDVLLIYLKRKCIPEASAYIRECCPNALITVNDVRQLRNGFIRK